MAANMYEVMELLHWTEEEYFLFKVDMGREYLRHLMGDERTAVIAPAAKIGINSETVHFVGDYEIMVSSPYFWSWWRLQWLERENGWLADLAYERCEAMKTAGKVLNATFGNHGSSTMGGSPISREAEMIYKVPVGLARNSYKRLNDGRLLAEACTPNGIVMEESYCRDLAPLLK